MPVNLEIYKAIVRVTNVSDREGRTSLGSGVIFTPTGLVLTNNHVVEDADFGTAFGQISVEWLERVHPPVSRCSRAAIVIRNGLYDLAVLKITERPPKSFLDFTQQHEPVEESYMERPIRIIGYPPIGGSTITVTRGIISGFDESGNIKTDAEVNPGNSGGAALDDFDHFLGIPTFIVPDANGKIGFIIPIDRIKEWIGIITSSRTETNEQLAATLDGKLIFGNGNVDQSTQFPRILGKFAAVELLLSNKEWEKTFPHIRFILERRPRSALAYHYLGNALLGLGRYVDAADQYAIAINYDPTLIPALGNYGIALTQLERLSEAIGIFQQILDSSENPAELWAAYGNMAQIYKLRNRPDLSELYAEKAREFNKAATERLSKYRHFHEPADKISAVAKAIVDAELNLEE